MIVGEAVGRGAVVGETAVYLPPNFAVTLTLLSRGKSNKIIARMTVAPPLNGSGPPTT